jgi:DNA invertase Pin-like site-specific DNA recombinase
MGLFWYVADVKTPAFAYLRTSGLGQAKGDGLTRQREAIHRYAKANRIEVVQEFVDNGVSGAKDGFDREGLTALFVAIKSNGVRLVLTENADRLARDLMVSEIIISEFRKVGVKIVAADSGTDLTVEDGEPTRKLVRQILAAISEFDKTRIVQKLRAARTRIRRDKGRCKGRKPFGVDQREQEVIGKMRQMRQDGMSFTKIGKVLNEAGIAPRKATRAGRPARWHAPMVQRILDRVGAKTTKP